LARTNYSYGKRLRELAKKQKREAKMQKRLERKQGGTDSPDADSPDTDSPLEESAEDSAEGAAPPSEA
jgi:hypothetical protein